MHPEDNFRIAGYELDDEWFNVEKGAHLPEGNEWSGLTLITVNLDPDNPEGFYRNASLLGGLDPPGEGYDIYELVDELRSRYPFLLQ